MQPIDLQAFLISKSYFTPRYCVHGMTLALYRNFARLNLPNYVPSSVVSWPCSCPSCPFLPACLRHSLEGVLAVSNGCTWPPSRPMGVSVGFPAPSVIVTGVAPQQQMISTTSYLSALRWLLCVSDSSAYWTLALALWGRFSGRRTCQRLFNGCF